MLLLETGIYIHFWNDILERTDATSKTLQSPKMTLNCAVASIKSLATFVQSKRECFNEYEQRAAELTGTLEYKTVRQRVRNVRLKPLDYSNAPAAQLTPSEKFRVENFLPVIDNYLSALSSRLSAYDYVSSLFGFFSKLTQISPNGLKEASDKLVEAYNDDLDSCLGNELIQFQEFVNVFKDEEEPDVSKEQFMYTLIHEKSVQDEFPNVEIALRIYLVLMITNCSAERSFSRMKLIKNRLRTSMIQSRLTNLTLLSTERDLLDEIHFDDIIADFANRKARKVPF